MTTPPLVGMIGKAGAGKDTFAARLVEAHGFRRIAFADALKNVAFDTNPIIGWDQIALEPIYLADWIEAVGWDTAKKNSAVRRLLQTLGVAVRDHVHDQVWINAALGNVVGSTPVVVTDVRFPNEARRIREDGGVLVRVERPGLIGVNPHVSETALDAFVTEYVVRNDRTLAEFHREADLIAADVMVAASRERV